MSVEYDELYIATMKEIDVCETAIKKLSKILDEKEKRYGISTAEFMERFGGCGMINNRDYIEWHDSFTGLKNWEQRLIEFRKILRGERAEKD